MTVDAYVVVGLGNPGPAYAGNRHNVGAMVVAELASRGGALMKRHKARVQAAGVRLGVADSGVPGPKGIVAQPTAFMNACGGPVKALLRYYSVPAHQLIVVHDDLDLPFGRIRIKSGGGEGGHNGLRSITQACGTRDYVRVRVGVGRPPGRMDPADYVLRDFPFSERAEVELMVGAAADAVELIANRGVVLAQQQVHSPS